MLTTSSCRTYSKRQPKVTIVSQVRKLPCDTLALIVINGFLQSLIVVQHKVKHVTDDQ